MEFNFMTVLAKVATDADERASFLTDPRAYLVAGGLDIPAFFEVTTVEIQGSAPTLVFGVPPILNMDELSEEMLANVGGGASCATCAM